MKTVSYVSFIKRKNHTQTKKILKSIEENSGVDISKNYNDFIEVFSMIESLYFTYIPQMPLIDEFKKEVNEKST